MKGEALLLLVSVLIRLVLLWQRSHEWLGQRIEISAPINQWKRIREGIALLEEGLSPYAGDIFHETPIVLELFKVLYSLGEWAVGTLFVVIDLLIALCLAKITVLHRKEQVDAQVAEQGSYGNGVENILVKEDPSLPLFVAIAKGYSVASIHFVLVLMAAGIGVEAIYLLNPYSILTCGGYSTISITNLAMVLAIWMKLRDSDILSSLGLAVAAYLSLYPVVLIFPFLLISFKRCGVYGVIQHLSLVTLWVGLLLLSSYHVTGSWEFINAVHGVILTVPDQTPNVGLFWYFFTETFEHFRVFFLCIFQINAFIYVLPLTVRFSNHPMFLTYILLSLMALFKSYPCVGDVTIPLALLPLWTHTFRYLRYTLVVLVMFLLASALGPVLWYLWIHAGSANANFFFAMTLTYALAQIFLVSDIIYSFLVHQYDLRHGLPRVDAEGRPLQLKLS